MQNTLTSDAWRIKKHSRRALRMLVLALLLVACMTVAVASPQKAYAKSYEMPQVTIDAQLRNNGDMHVSETRTFTFEGTYSAVWWSFDRLPSYSSLTVNSVSLKQGSTTTKLSAVPFNLEWRDQGGPGKASYSVDIPKNSVYVFFAASDETVSVTLDYVVSDVATVYQDTAELYWQIVGSSWEEDSEQVTMNLSLPVPRDQTVEPGNNVRAWGHGPLDASVQFEADGTISYSIPSVSAGQYAEARVVFPASWMTGVAPTDKNAQPNQARLDAILTEEQQWADNANTQRITQTVVLLVAIVLSLVACVWAFWNFIRYGKELKPTFTDEYWRDVPEKGTHPAVIARLCRFDKEDSHDFTATIMHLVNEGAVSLHQGTYQQGKKSKEDYYLERVDSYAPQTEIDRKALSILFDMVAQGESTVWMHSIKQYAENNPQAFSDAMQSWQGLLSAQVIQEQYFEAYSKSKRFQVFGVAVALIAVCGALGVVFNNYLTFIPALLGALVIALLSRFMERRTQKGADIYARCEALKKWLTDFSTLKERPVQDVKVWGVFMVYAYVFGVARKVMKELQDTMPHLFDETNPGASGTSGYGIGGGLPWWVMYSGSHSSHGAAGNLADFSSVFDNTIASSVSAVTSTLSGDLSDVGGMGGGFSIGGGGGFGGGGGAR